MDLNVLHQFTSHIDGKNAQVQIYRDRIEWVRPRSASKGKLTAGVLTMGLSLAATGVKDGKSGGTEMIPVKSMSSVTTKRDGFLNTKVSVITSGNTVDFRVAHAEAQVVQDVLTQLILGSHPSQQGSQPVPVPVAPLAQPAGERMSIADRLSQIESLHRQGILTDDERSAKRAIVLSDL